MLAREIHAWSARYRRDMITVDMGAITESLFESELFGHKKGSFTDAHTAVSYTHLDVYKRQGFASYFSVSMN